LPERDARVAEYLERITRSHKVDWDNALLINVPKIDTAHKHLVDSVNRIAQLIIGGENPSYVSTLLATLAIDIDEHFADEERTMEGAAYPLYDEHKRTHHELMACANAYCDRFIYSDNSLERVTLLVSIQRDIAMHMAIDDAKFGRFLAAKGDAAFA
jgi:hemerythrin